MVLVVSGRASTKLRLVYLTLGLDEELEALRVFWAAALWAARR